MTPSPATILIVALGLVVVGCGSARRTEPVASPLALSAQEARGETVFMRACNQCHPRGESGLGPALNSVPAPGFLIKFQVRNGLGAMPAFSESELSPGELDDLVAYLMAVRRNG